MFKYPYGDSQQLNLDWILRKLKELEEAQGQQITEDLEVISNALISATFSSSNAYNRSDIVYHDGKLYRANVNIPAPGESWNPAHWDEILIGDTLSNVVTYLAALNNTQVFNSSNVPGTHTNDALNNLKTDIDGLDDVLDQTLGSKTAVDFSAATQGNFVSYPDGTVYNHTDYQVLRHVILEKGQTIYVTTCATSNVAPLSLEISGPDMQPLCQGTDSTSSFYYTATQHCQITVCTNFVETYSCYIAGAFVSLTDGVNDLYNNVDNLNGAIKTVFNGKKALIIGDSYNKGQNNHGWGYYFKTVTGMGDNVTSIQQNGGGFGRVAQSGADYEGEYYYQAIAHISTDIDFDYIVAQAGRNDAYSPEDTTGAILINGINQFVSVCKARWPNAKVFIFPTNNDSPLDDAHYKFMRLIPETALKNGVFTSFQSFKWFYDTNLNHSDGAHLIESGYELLAQYIASCIAGWNGILPEQKYDHKNLLINSVFAKFIVNNRGIATSTTGSSKTCLFDCWFGARAEVTVNTDSISLKWDGVNGSNGYIAQRHLEIERNAHVTMSAVIDNTLYFKTWTLNANQTTYNYQVNSQLYFRLELFNDGSAQFTLYNYSATAMVISGIKLEYGNEQTLATEYEGNLIIIDGTTYSEEIQKCRTMLIPIYYSIGVGQNQYYCGVRGYSNARTVAYEIPDLRKMVGTPTLEYDTLQGAVIDRAGTSRSITDIAINGNMGLYFTVADDLATGMQAIYFNRIVYITSE